MREEMMGCLIGRMNILNSGHLILNSSKWPWRSPVVFSSHTSKELGRWNLSSWVEQLIKKLCVLTKQIVYKSLPVFLVGPNALQGWGATCSTRTGTPSLMIWPPTKCFPSIHHILILCFRSNFIRYLFHQMNCNESVQHNTY